MKFVVSSFVFFILMLSVRVRAEKPVLYTAKVTDQQNAGDHNLFFPLGPQKWLVVDPDAMRSWVLEPNALSEPQNIIKDESVRSAVFLAKWFNPKDGIVLMVWSQPESPAAKDRQVKHFMSRYKNGIWSAPESIPGQGTFSLGSSTLISDEAGRILVLWRQDAPENTTPPTDNPVSQHTGPTKEIPKKPKAWFYSVIAETGPSPATLVPGQGNLPWLPSPQSFFAQKSHRVVIVFEAGQAQATTQKRQLAYGFWQDGSLQAFQPLTKEGDNGSNPPEFMTTDAGSLRMMWAYRKNGTNTMAKTKPPIMLRYAELEHEKPTFGPVRTLSMVHYLPNRSQFVRTSEKGLFTAWVERPNPAKPATELHSLYFAKDGSVSTQHVSFLSKKAERDDATYVIGYQPTLDGKVAIALGATNQSTVQHALVYTSYWDKGKLAPVRLLPNQGEALKDIILPRNATGTPILVWTQRAPNSDATASQEIYVSSFEEGGFLPAKQITKSAQVTAGNIHFFHNAQTTKLVWGRANTENTFKLYQISMRANGQWTQPLSLENPLGSPPETSYQRDVIYTGAKGEQLFILQGSNGVSSLVCEQEHCARARQWTNPQSTDQSAFETFYSEADGSLLVRWFESSPPPPPRRNRKRQPAPVPTESVPSEPIFFMRIVHFPNFPTFKSSDPQ